MDVLSKEERALVVSIKERKAAREREAEARAELRADLKKSARATFMRLTNAPMKPGVMLMNEKDYEDIVKWTPSNPVVLVKGDTLTIKVAVTVDVSEL